MRSVAIPLCALVLAGCGSSGLSSADKQQASNEFAMAQSSVEGHLADQSDISPALEAIARRALLEQDTEAIVALVRKWDDKGMSGKELLRHLNDAETALRSCPTCLVSIDRERENYR